MLFFLKGPAVSDQQAKMAAEESLHMTISPPCRSVCRYYVPPLPTDVVLGAQMLYAVLKALGLLSRCVRSENVSSFDREDTYT